MSEEMQKINMFYYPENLIQEISELLPPSVFKEENYTLLGNKPRYDTKEAEELWPAEKLEPDVLGYFIFNQLLNEESKEKIKSWLRKKPRIENFRVKSPSWFYIGSFMGILKFLKTFPEWFFILFMRIEHHLHKKHNTQDYDIDIEMKNDPQVFTLAEKICKKFNAKILLDPENFEKRVELLKNLQGIEGLDSLIGPISWNAHKYVSSKTKSRLYSLHVDKISWGFISEKLMKGLIQMIKDLGVKTILTINDGNDIVGYLLSKYGFRVISTDLGTEYHIKSCYMPNQERLSSLEAVKKYGSERNLLILSQWPRSGILEKVIPLLKGKDVHLIIETEDGMGAQASEETLELADKYGERLNDDHFGIDKYRAKSGEPYLNSYWANYRLWRFGN